MANEAPRDLIVGRPVLLVIDIQKGSFHAGEDRGIPHMPGYAERVGGARVLIDKARDCAVPVVFFQEAHRRDRIDFGRELDGAEGVHCLEGNELTEIAADRLGLRRDDYVIAKRRYSCFFGTDLEILLKGLGASTLVLCGGLTDVCVHYTFVDGHQHDYHCRVAEECVAGSSRAAHDAALTAMAYLQTGARRENAEILAAFEAVAERGLQAAQ